MEQQILTEVPSVSGLHTVTEIGSVPGVATLTEVANASGGLQWYAYTADGVGPILAINGQPLQVDLSSPEIARQFNQQVQTPYGNIQVQALAPAILGEKQQLHYVEEVGVDGPCTGSQKPNSTKSRRHGVGERVPCPECGKTVSCNATLRDHMRTHSGERPFVCTECGLAFAQRSNLRMHKRLHTGERPYMCGICGKTFARSSHLPAHMRTHTGEKPYECEICSHSFITGQQLKNHHRVHTGEKPWKCESCDAAFTHSSSLSTHRKKHLGVKPFQCERCHKSFFFTSALEKHLKVHSKARPYTCDLCNKSFKYKESLTVHREKYCGQDTVEKPKPLPRRNTEGKQRPGPKPGNGRKYVQTKKAAKKRGRGRPRKKTRWSTRNRPRKVFHEYDSEEDPDDEVLEEIVGDQFVELDSKEGILEGVEAAGINVFHPSENVTVTMQESATEIHLEESLANDDDGGNTGIPVVQINADGSTSTHQLVMRDGSQLWYPSARGFQ